MSLRLSSLVLIKGLHNEDYSTAFNVSMRVNAAQADTTLTVKNYIIKMMAVRYKLFTANAQ